MACVAHGNEHVQDGDGLITLDEFVPVVEELLIRKRKKKKSSPRKMWALAGTAARLANDKAIKDTTSSSNVQSVATTSTFDVLRLRREGLRAMKEGNLKRAEDLMSRAGQIAERINPNSAQHVNILVRLVRRSGAAAPPALLLALLLHRWYVHLQRRCCGKGRQADLVLRVRACFLRRRSCWSRGGSGSPSQGSSSA